MLLVKGADSTKKSLPILLCFVCAVTGCKDKSDSRNTETTEKTLLTELDITHESVTDSIEKLSNVIVAEDMEILVPENVDSVYFYTSRPDTSVDMESYYNDFIELYNYIYPDHPMNEDYLLYCGGSSVIEYDDNGNWIKYVDFNSSGQMTGYRIREYDSNNRLMKETTYNANGEVVSTVKYE